MSREGGSAPWLGFVTVPEFIAAIRSFPKDGLCIIEPPQGQAAMLSKVPQDDVLSGDRDGPSGDVIRARDGVDFVFGGEGNDTISGRLGNDVLSGAAGDDIIEGNFGANDV